MKILFVEDLPLDAELAERLLRKDGLDLESLRVDTQETFLEALEGFRPDVIISDYSMPAFDGMSALLLVRQHDPHLPFIVLTGTINEDTAVACMKAGANDYVIKEHMSRLSFAVKEAIELGQTRLRTRQQEELLRQNEERYRTLFDGSSAVMLIVDPEDGRITDANKTALAFYGLPGKGPIGMTLDQISTESNDQILERLLSVVKLKLRVSESRHRKADGTEVYVELHSGPILIEGKTLLLVIIHDISERYLVRERLESSLKEKEALLREIHHRVNNNLQVISSLLSLSAARSTDTMYQSASQAMIRRIAAMALAHEQLYSSQDVSRIGFSLYLREIVDILVSSEDVTQTRPNLEFLLDEIFLNLEEAIPAGIAVSELVSNALRHGVHGMGDKGRIRIEMHELQHGELQIKVEDNGPGFPEGVDPSKAETLGLRLVEILSTQLQGTIEYNVDGGTRAVLRFTPGSLS
jgi:PAS domain S-box-containing protein